MKTTELFVPSQLSNVRLDFFVAQELKSSLSRTKIKQLIEAGKITLNDQTVKPHTHVSSLDRIVITYEDGPVDTHRAEAIPLQIVFEDEDLMIVNKPAGLVVHPGSGNPSGTLVNALLHYTKSLSTIGSVFRPGIVHRLDKDTSGLLVVAKNDRTHRSLGEQFKSHEIHRVYEVVVRGVVQHDEMRSREPLGRSVLNRKKIVVKPDDGKLSITNFRMLKRFKQATLLEARPETGRTHQIRVHLRALGYPVLGDLIYGVASPHIQRQALHAKELGFRHPTSNEKQLFSSDLPDDMVHLMKQLERAK